jgi:hypothetical protein
MVPIAGEGHNVFPKSFVLTHHQSMTTRPDDLTITICRLDAILERKLFVMMHGLYDVLFLLWKKKN